MNEVDDGGPAFPGDRKFKYYQMGDKEGIETVPGMSLRDYFAAKAMQGYLSSSPAPRSQAIKCYAYTAYLMADAMLKERKK